MCCCGLLYPPFCLHLFFTWTVGIVVVVVGIVVVVVVVVVTALFALARRKWRSGTLNACTRRFAFGARQCCSRVYHTLAVPAKAIANRALQLLGPCLFSSFPHIRYSPFPARLSACTSTSFWKPLLLLLFIFLLSVFLFLWLRRLTHTQSATEWPKCSTYLEPLFLVSTCQC
jgi:hypothetical protein